MPRRVYLLGVGLALVALALAFTDWALSLQPGVTEANFRRIRVGMTMVEVATILGQPAPPRAGVECNGVRIEGEFHVWQGQDGARIVTFGNDRVAWVGWYNSTRPTPLARLRAWLGW